MSDWRKENIERREKFKEERFRRIDDDFEKNEAVIREIDSEDMMILSKDSDNVFVGRNLVPIRKLYIAALDDYIQIEAGAEVGGADKEVVYACFRGGEEWFDIKAEKKDHEHIVKVVIKDELALDKAVAVFKGIGLIVEGFRKKYEAILAKMRESESNE